MRKTLEITASFTGTINTGSYENSKPFYGLKEVIELDNTDSLSDKFLVERQKELHGFCYEQFKKQAQRAEVDKIRKAYQNIRFYEVGDEQYPSVTSIIGWDDDFRCSQEELAQYGARGTIIHKQVEIFLSTGEWKEPKEIPEIYPDLVTLKQGSLGLTLEGYDFQAFFMAYPFKILSLEDSVVNPIEKYCGRLDIKCIIDSKNKGKWKDVVFDVPTILDIKTGQIDKTKGLKQQTAYARCCDVEQIGLIPLNKTTKQGFSQPVMCSDLDKYWTLFKADRAKFKNRFGV